MAALQFLMQKTVFLLARIERGEVQLGFWAWRKRLLEVEVLDVLIVATCAATSAASLFRRFLNGAKTHGALGQPHQVAVAQVSKALGERLTMRKLEAASQLVTLPDQLETGVKMVICATLTGLQDHLLLHQPGGNIDLQLERGIGEGVHSKIWTQWIWVRALYSVGYPNFDLLVWL